MTLQLTAERLARAERWFCQQQADRCLGSSDMTNTCELLQPPLKIASQSCCQAWTKRYVVVVPPGSWRGTLNLAPPGHRQGLRHLRCGSEHGKPAFLPLGRSTAKWTVGNAGMGWQRKQTPICNGLDRGCNITSHASEPTSAGSLIARRSASASK